MSYPRALFISIWAGVHTLYMSAIVLLLVALGYSRAEVNQVIRRYWARFILWMAGVRVEVRGVENVSKEQGSIVLFNHTSHTDILVLYGYFPRDVCFGAKIELFSVPFFGRAMLEMGAIPIDRKHREKVLQLYEAAIPRVASGDAFALAPEGTRQKEPKLGKFKLGPFLFGVHAQINLTPVVIAGTYDVLPKNSIWLNLGKWHRKVILEILNPLETRGLTEAEIPSLQSKVHGEMETAFERLKSELRSDQITFVKNR